MFLSYHFNSVYLWYLTLEQNVFIDYLEEFAIKIKYKNRDYLLTKNIEKIRLFCLKENSFKLSITINKILYI